MAVHWDRRIGKREGVGKVLLEIGEYIVRL